MEIVTHEFHFWHGRLVADKVLGNDSVGADDQGEEEGVVAVARVVGDGHDAAAVAGVAAAVTDPAAAVGSFELLAAVPADRDEVMEEDWALKNWREIKLDEKTLFIYAAKVQPVINANFGQTDEAVDVYDLQDKILV